MDAGGALENITELLGELALWKEIGRKQEILLVVGEIAVRERKAVIPVEQTSEVVSSNPLTLTRKLRSREITHNYVELPENWTDTRETLLEGMLFNLKYLGMTLVEQPKGEELSAAAVKRIVATAKASGKKLRKVTLKVSPRGIILHDSGTSELIENVSIYRISYCTADKMHDKVFAYIAQNQQSESLECHAFLCSKRKMAQAVTLTVAQAFKVAFELWQVSREEKEKREKASLEEVACGARRDASPSLKGPITTGNLLDLEETAKAPLSTVSANATNLDEVGRPEPLANNNVVWELDDGLDEAFSRLAQSRTNPQVLDIGLTAQDIQYAQCLSPVDWDKPDLGAPEQDDLFGF